MLGLTEARATHDLILAFDEGVELCDGTFNQIPVSAGGCELGEGVLPQGIVSGSYFWLDLDANGLVDVNEQHGIMVGPDGGIWVDHEQIASGAHPGAPDGSESPALDSPWYLFGATGMYYTDAFTSVGGISPRGVPISFISNPSSGSGQMDFSSMRAAWSASVHDIGGDPLQGDTGIATITCAPAPCAVGSSYILDYSAHPPASDPFYALPWQIHLEGTITSAGDISPPSQVNNTRSIVSALGATDTITNSELRFVDADPPASVAYAVTGGPAFGQLELTTAPGAPVSAFTQDDIDNNRLVYVQSGALNHFDVFQFTVSDSWGNATTSQSFWLDIDIDSDGLVGSSDNDTDGDGLSDHEESVFGSNHLMVDSDADGAADIDDVFPANASDQSESDRQEFSVSTDPALQRGPDISGNRVVYDDNRNGNYDIYMYDYTTGVETRITTDPGAQVGPSISGDRIVWRDSRNGNFDIYMYDLGTATETRITTDSGSQVDPIISGDRIVWYDTRNGNGDVYLYDLATSSEVRITTDPTNQTQPHISGDRIVWRDARNGNQDIYLYDLATGTETAITTYPGLESNPRISGDRVVWYDSRSGNNDIYLYDLSTSTETQITTDPASQWFPAISGNRIAWQDERHGNSDVYVYDIASSTETRITSDPAGQTIPEISRDRIAWQDDRNGNTDVFVFAGDAIADSIDNCPAVYNPNQADTDLDGIGDACDTAPSVLEIGFGSWFGLDMDDNDTVDVGEQYAMTPGTDGGIVLGQVQSSLGAIDAATTFFGQPWNHYSDSPIVPINSSSIDMSGWKSQWNTNADVVPYAGGLTGAFTCSGTPCSAGDTYTLDLSFITTSGVFGTRRYTVHLAGTVTEDTDGDGLRNTIDNCPNQVNPDQTDTDADGQGDVCDSDDDGDGLSDSLESTLGTNPLLVDSDGDGASDFVEETRDSDPATHTPGVDLDPNDPDSDNDGYLDGGELQFGSDPLDGLSVPGSPIRVSTASNGLEGDGGSDLAALSGDGRYVAFASPAINLVAGDGNAQWDVFIKDTLTGVTTRVSTDSSGVEGNAFSFDPSLSADGRYVGFASSASNLVADGNAAYDVFVKDRQTGITTRVSTNSSGVEGDAGSFDPNLSADGRYVAFPSLASNLVTDDNNSVNDIFVKDTQTGVTTRVSTDSSGVEGNGASTDPAISADGRYVVFQSDASNLVGVADGNGVTDIFLKDTLTGETTRVSTDSSGVEGDDNSTDPAISADGRYVVFQSDATNLVGTADGNGVSDIFLKDTLTGETTRVSTDSSGVEGNGASFTRAISADGRYVAFASDATNLAGTADDNGVTDIFVKDMQTGVTARLSTDSGGTEGNGASTVPVLSADGRYLGFTSLAFNLVGGDDNGVTDVFRAENTLFVPDTDEDGLRDDVDNCPNNVNPGQEDTDLDGSGDACDSTTLRLSFSTGSYWWLDNAPENGAVDVGETVIDLSMGPEGGIQIGQAQPAFGSHAGSPDGSESPSVDMPWVLFGNTGMTQSLSPVLFATPTELDFSGWSATWNGLASIPLGGDSLNFPADTGVASISCDNTPCQAGDNFVLSYFAHVPVDDPSSFGGMPYGLHLEGTVADFDLTLPNVVNSTGVAVDQGGSIGIWRDHLWVIDDGSGPASVTYTVTSVPVNGQLELTTNPGEAVATFTQQDISLGRLVYVHGVANADPDSFMFSVDDGAGNTLSASFNITVIAPPEIDLDADDSSGASGNDYQVTHIENIAVPVTDSDVAITDPRGLGLWRVEVALTNAVLPEDVLSIAGSLPSGILSTVTSTLVTLYDDTGVPGYPTAADYQVALQQVRYNNVSNSPNLTARVFAITPFDTPDTYGPAATTTVTINAVNDPPVANDDVFTVNEDSSNNALSVLANDTDPEGAALEVMAITTPPVNGSATISLDKKKILYTPNPNSTTGDTLAYQIRDPGNATSQAVVFITVNAVNDPPSLDLNPGNPDSTNVAVTYTEGAGPVPLLAAGANISDPDGGLLSGATIAITTPQAGDQLSLAASLPAGITVASQTDTFIWLQSSPPASVADYQTALALLQYQSTTVNPDPSLRNIAIVVNDEVPAASNAAYVNVSIVLVNDPPTLDLDLDGGGTGYSATYVAGKGSSPVAVVDADVTISDDSGVIKGAQVSLNNAQTGDVLSVTGLPAGITLAAGSTSTALILTGNAPTADYQAALAAVRFANTLANPASVARDISVVVTDEEDENASATATVSIVFAPIVDLNGDDAITGNEGQDYSTRFEVAAIDPVAVVDSDAVILDGDSSELSRLVITLTNPGSGDELTLDEAQLASLGLGISLDPNSTATTRILTGVASLANYQSALALVGFRNTQLVPDVEARVITFVATDAPGNLSGQASTTTVAMGSDFAVSFVPMPEIVLADASLSYTINVTNVGAEQASDVVLTSVLSEDSFVTLADGNGWDCNDFQAGANPTVICSLPSLASGESTQVTVEIMTPAVTARIGNSVSVTNSNPALGTGTALQSNLAVDFGNYSASGDRLKDEDNAHVPVVEYGDAYAHFGQAVALHGDLLVVGSPVDLDAAALYTSGAVVLYERQGETWNYLTRIEKPGAHTGGDGFGSALAYDGSLLVVGAPGAGVAYVYDAATLTTTQDYQQLLVSDGSQTAGDQFGDAVSLSGNRIAVAAPRADIDGVDSGRVYLFERSGPSWAQGAAIDSTELPTVIPGASRGNSWFGSGLALQGDRLVVGAPYADPDINQGAALVYEFADGAWQYRQALLKPTIDRPDRFGRAVAMDGDTVVVGAQFHGIYPQSGAVEVFVLGGDGVWAHQQRVLADDAVGFEQFGSALALQGDTLLVGAPKGLSPDEGSGSDIATGAAYLFQRTGTVWNQQQKIAVAPAVVDDGIGAAVAIHGDTFAIGIPFEDGGDRTDSGAVVVARIGVIDEHKLTAFDGTLGAQFGHATAVSGDTLVVGAPYQSRAGLVNAGVAYVYRRQDADWAFEQKLLAADAAAGDTFGWSVAIAGDKVSVGAPRKDMGSSSEDGAVYVFQRFGTVWIPLHQVQSPSAHNGEQFGWSVAMSGDWLAIGAPHDARDPGVIADEGLVHVYNFDPGMWALPSVVAAADASSGRSFGTAVDIEGDRLAVAANGSGGGAYVFDYAGSWTQQGKVTGDAPLDTVAVSGDTLLAGAPGDGTVASGAGAVHVFANIASTWTPAAKLYAGDARADGGFGTSLALFGDELLIGAPGSQLHGVATGAAYLFERVDVSDWLQRQQLRPSDAQLDDAVGGSAQAVALSLDARIVAAPMEDGSGSNTDYGAVYTYFTAPAPSIPGGIYNGNQLVSLSCDNCADIYYTTNGSTPIADAAYRYTEPLIIETTTELQFIGVDGRGNSTTVWSETFVVDTVDPTVAMTSAAYLQPDAVLREALAPIQGSADDGTGSGVRLVQVELQDQGTGRYLTLDGGNGDSTEPVWLDASSSDNWQTWSLNLSFNPFTEESTYRMRVRAFDNAGNVSAIETHTFTYFIGTPLFTTLNLSPSSSSISSGGSVSVNMDLSVLAELGMDLSGQDLCLHITAPTSGTVQEVLAHTDVDGFVNVTDLVDTINVALDPSDIYPDFAFNEEGTYTLRAEYMQTQTAGAVPGSVSGLSCAAGDLGSPVVSLQASSDTRSVVVGASPGYALLVQGLLTGDELGRRTHNLTMERVHDAMKARSLDDASIYYYNFDTNQDGFVDSFGGGANGSTGIDEVPDKATIRDLLIDPASPLAVAVSNAPGTVTLLFGDHGSTDGVTGTFYMGAETITSAELGLWLDQFQANLAVLNGGRAANVPIVTIVGACFSGSWLNDLQGLNRVNIASAAPGEESYRGPNEPVPASVDPSGFLRTGEFFVEELFKAAEQGVSLRDAFEWATAQTELYTQIDDSGAGMAPFNDNAAQHPLLDDNGFFDGSDADLATSNELLPTNGGSSPDGLLASTLYLGVAPGTSFDPSLKGEVADVVTVSDSIYLNTGENSTVLFLKANNNALVSDAWVEIRKLSVALPAGSGGSATATFQSDNDQGGASLRVPMAKDASTGRFIASPSVFTDAGQYRVFYYVRDVLTGDISPTRSSLVYKNSSANGSTPTPPTLLHPLAGQQTATTLLLSWTDSSDADVGDNVTYTVEVAELGAGDTEPDFDPEDIVYRREELVSSYHFIGADAGLADLGGNGYYYWRVTAVDTFGSRATSAWSSFTTNNTNGYTGSVYMTVTNTLSDIQLSGGIVTASSTSTGASVAPLYQEDRISDQLFIRVYPTGVYDLTLSGISGYYELTKTADLVKTPELSLNVTLVTGDSDGDGLSDDEEASFGSQSSNIDSDGDGLVDGFDGNVTVGDFLARKGYSGVDSNSDGFVDGERDPGILTDPIDGDSDNDGLGDGLEVSLGTSPTDPASYIADGDLNGNGGVDAGDYLLAQRIVLGLVAQESWHLGHADMNGNGTIDVGDLVLLMRAM